MELESGGVGRGEAACWRAVCGAMSSLGLWLLPTCWQVEATASCWPSTLAVGVVVFREELSRFWPRLAWTLLWALSRGLGRGRPLMDSSRSTTSSRVQAWAAGRKCAELRERARDGNKAKGHHLPHGRGSQGLPNRLCPPACLAPPSFSPSLARSTARFTRFSRASQSSWPERPAGSRCMRPCSTDSSWADAGEQLTCSNQNRKVDGHPRPWAGGYPPAHARPVLKPLHLKPG